MISRRSLLVGGASIVGLSKVKNVLAVPEQALCCRVVFDGQLAEGCALAHSALNVGLPTLDTAGEPVRVFTGSHKFWLATSSPLIGFTRYSEFMQIEDMARAYGRKVGLIFYSNGSSYRKTQEQGQLSSQALAAADFLLASVPRHVANVFGWVII